MQGLSPITAAGPPRILTVFRHAEARDRYQNSPDMSTGNLAVFTPLLIGKHFKISSKCWYLKWTAFAGAWTTGLAYLASSLFYQLATFGRHPASFLMCVGIEVSVFVVTIIIIMRYFGHENREAESTLATAEHSLLIAVQGSTFRVQG